MIKIGFIGCGNMARPIIKGIIANGISKAEDVLIYIYDIRRDALLEFCGDTGATPVEDYAGITEVCDIIVLATKPQTFPELLPDIAESVNKKKPFIVSIAAGKTTEYIASFFADDIAVGRIFPNLNAEVMQSVSAYCANKNASIDNIKILSGICEAYGSAIALDESLFSVFGVLSGCAPAYTFMYIGALAEAAADKGLDPSQALEVACKMAMGSALTLDKSGKSPDEMIKRVCSPGGTTIEGISYLRENGFEDTVKKAFTASYEKDKRM